MNHCHSEAIARQLQAEEDEVTRNYYATRERNRMEKERIEHERAYEARRQAMAATRNKKKDCVIM